MKKKASIKKNSKGQVTTKPLKTITKSATDKKGSKKVDKKVDKKGKKVKNIPKVSEDEKETKTVRSSRSKTNVVANSAKDTKVNTPAKKNGKDNKKSAKKDKKVADKQVNGGKPVIVTNNNIANVNKKSKKVDPVVDDEDEDEEEDKKAAKAATKNKVTVIEKGGAVVDRHLPNNSKYHVAPDRSSEYNGKFFDVTFNCSDLKNNNNKFYKIQVLGEDNTNHYYLFTRWGRVGKEGPQSLMPCRSLEHAKQEFMKKYNEKLGKRYIVIEIDYSKDGDNKKEENKKTAPNDEESRLPRPLKELIELIYNTDLMGQQMKEIGYDASKMPLGRLGKSTIEEGYKVLKEIEQVIDGKKKGDLYVLSSKFYSIIPHNFGFQHMSLFVIKDKAMVKAKVDMIQSLVDIEIATKILDEAVNPEVDLLESHYNKLLCDINHIPSHSSIFSTLDTFLTNTSSDNAYQKLELLEAFELKKHGELEKFDDKGNKKLLWHGSRITNYVGILSQGLRIAPPEAPCSGYLFGKGVYFADMASKSACYCGAGSNNVALMLLCEVALGNPNQLLTHDPNASKLPNGTDSTKGCGVTVPSEEIDMDGVKVPLGKPIKSEFNTFLGYNEYIVYNTNQVKLRYLLKIKVSSHK